MSITITGKLNEAANEFQAGESIGFGMRLGEKYYDRDTQQNEWTNYKFVIFAKKPAQINFYRDALQKGAVIEVTGKRQKIDKYEGQNGLSLSIEIIDASLGFISTDGAEAGTTQAPQSAPQQRPAPQQAPGAPAPSKPQYVMTSKADGYTMEEYIKQGWTVESLLSGGYMEEEPPF
jgi:single-strand DNA-binding protein